MFSTTASARLQADGDPLDYADALIASGQPGEAAKFLRSKIEAGRGGLLTRLALVRALRESGDLPGALKAAREASALNSNVAEAAIGLGEVLMAAGYLPTAIAEFQRALRLEPHSAHARFQLGCAWAAAGEAEKALQEYSQVPADDVPGLGEHIAAAEAMRTRSRSDAGYVRHLFDQFSSGYDARMRDQLAYRAPEILRELAGLVMPGAHDLVALDLGCGTGLAGEVFSDLAPTIDGIDLSPAMIERARARSLYRHLTVADIETALAHAGPDYDLVVAADTLVYLGDLTVTLAGVYRGLKPGGFFLFTVESSVGRDFELGPKRRWRHSQAYVRGAATAARMEVAGMLLCSPRTEAGVPVDGFAAALTRPSQERIG